MVLNSILDILCTKTRKIKILGRGVLRDEFLLMWELSGWQSEHFLIASYGLKTTSRRPELHFWLFWKERPFFVWFWLLLLLFWLLFFLNLYKSRYIRRKVEKRLFQKVATFFLSESSYPFLDLPTPFWIFLPLFGSSYPFFQKVPLFIFDIILLKSRYFRRKVEKRLVQKVATFFLTSSDSSSTSSCSDYHFFSIII